MVAEVIEKGVDSGQGRARMGHALSPGWWMDEEPNYLEDTPAMWIVNGQSLSQRIELT
jgi:hypothetical protein